MKRHLLGFALFNLIVGTSLLVWIYVRMNNEIKQVRPAVGQYEYEVSRESCWRGVRQNAKTPKKFETSQDSIKVTQAVFNEKTRKMNISFLIQRETPSTQDVKVKLTFVNSELKDKAEWETNFKSDYIEFAPNFSVDNKAVYSMTYRFPVNLKSNGNLYVSAELVKDSSSDSDFISKKVDYSDFTPVLLTDKSF